MAYLYDSDDDELLEFAAIAALSTETEKDRRPRSCWVRPWLQRRESLGAYNALMKELEVEDTRAFSNFLRMSQDSFVDLLHRVSPIIIKQDTPMRSAITPGEKLAITLRYLATGDSYQSLEYLYRIPKNTICGFVPDVCQAIYESLRDEYLKVPTTEEEWKTVSAGFEERWQFPHCIGALDGKHIAIRAPSNSGSTYYNYKNFFSLILLALVDSNYKFVYVDVGANGRASDAGVWANSNLSLALESNKMRIPPPTPLYDQSEPMPYVIVGDDAFPLKTYLMKPYPFRNVSGDSQVFNYRLSRARRISENAFGILTNRFGIFQRPLSVETETGVKIILAAVSLHNYLRSVCDKTYMEDSSALHMGGPTTSVPSRDNSFVQQGGNRNSVDARLVRDEFKEYFCTVGAVDWQWDNVHI